MKKRFLSAVMALMMVLNTGCAKNENGYMKDKSRDTDLINITETKLGKYVRETPEIKDIVVSAIGDCTLGTDDNFGYDRSFTQVLDCHDRDFSYFFSGVYDILSNDDLTIANLETTFTDANVKNEKTFNFKGDFDYTNILDEGSVEAVNIANNHTYDYLEKGYQDTKDALLKANIPYFGYENYSIYSVKGVTIGLAGIPGWNQDTAKNYIDKAISYFRENEVDLIILSFHWGIERDYIQNSTQISIGHYAVDHGADLVIGHHPHVLQGIECYNGKYIVYSLGNFVFGGSKNPKDKDTMIFQQIFHFENGELIDTSYNIIPCSLSSQRNLNDYRPMVLEGEEEERVLKKVLSSSTNF